MNPDGVGVARATRPALSMRSSLRDTVRVMAEAMLAGSPERGSIVSWMAAVPGDAPAWSSIVIRIWRAMSLIS
ncbi:hypothetical protein [Burkholderia stabilis]|uniref:hypothetical protein n=1 Tax=Burkholderia stabilis TaxID=95485 RepID=UPI0015900B14